MASLDWLDLLFIGWAFFFQISLIAFFALRKAHLAQALRWGPLVYALGIPALGVSLVLLWGGKSWPLWLGGFLCLIWAVFGYTVEYVRGIQWREPPVWAIYIPYLFLYLATIMFYWWPLATLARPLWAAYAILFVISTGLNVASHRGSIRA